MVGQSTLRFVVDTNVVFEGLTKQGSASGYLIDAWYAELFLACVTNTVAYEYADVLARKLSANRWKQVQPALGRLLTLSEFVTVHFRWRPILPDVGDDHFVDCAMNANATVVTWNLKDFRAAQETLGLPVLTPMQAVDFLLDR